jgi:signal transduction histidine kinase/DNA-binding LacI/PurR family transcriptional regulator/AraC-like DNA-binding protein/DNA-binding LytR/AlgR family response regulator
MRMKINPPKLKAEKTPAPINAPRKSMPNGDSRRKRPTFGFIVNWGLTNPISVPMWWGAVEVAKALDVNLIGFGDINIYDLTPNRSLYQQLQPSALDGLILVNPTFSRLQDVVFGSLPVVNIGCSMEDVVTSILVDNYDGMRAAVRHMIETHGCRRLAFIKGPVGSPDAEERFQAYVDVLQSFDLTVDPDLLYQPFDWSSHGGEEGVRILLDERGMRFDALIAANDNMALAAMAEIQSRGMRVPYDIVVSGFDDAIEAPTSTPPLTTVRQPLKKMGQLALEALLAHHQGKSVPQKFILPTTLLLRHSCGCLSEAVLHAGGGMPVAKRDEKTADQPDKDLACLLLEGRREILLGEVHRAMVLRDVPAFSRTAEEWLDALTTSLKNEDSGDAFLTAIDLTSRRLMEQQISVAKLQDVLSTLRREACRAMADHPILLAGVENLWHRARVFLDEIVLQQQIQMRVRLNDQMAVLRAISQTMAVTFHLDNLMDVLARDMKKLGIPSCAVALYDGVNRPAEWARVIMAVDNDRRLVLNDQKRHPVAQLLPADLWGEQQRTLLHAEIGFQSEEIGFVLFEVGPHDGAVYEALRSQLGSSIKGALMFDERDLLLTDTTQLYRQAAAGQRLAEEANRLKGRFLSMVSHELRTPLNLIAGLSELMLTDAETKKPLQSDKLRLVHTTTQHLENLIRDVLDLARDEMGELRLVCEPLDLAKVLEAVTVVGEQLTREHGLGWQVKIPSGLPLIWGDPTRLRQVVLNLLNNAVKFTEKGEVGLLVTPGKEAITVSVVDTGLGINPAEQGVIFDEFRQADRTTARGYGGLGLGLAICKRLVEMHNGQIGVHSTGVEGEGATFFFTIPTLQAMTLGGESIPADWIITTRPEKAQPLKKYLEGQGIKAEIMYWDENGQWLKRIVQTPPAAVVLDVQKTHRRGLEAMRALKAHPATSEITVLFYTLEVEQDSGAMLELDYLSKPISAPELAKAIRRAGWVERSGASDETLDGSKTILIVDDDPGVLELHAQIVRAGFPQHQILLASGGREALRILQCGKPDLMLLDLMMPELDGFGVLEAMQKMETARQVPVIVLSAKTLIEEEMSRLSRSVAAVLRKGMFSSAETLSHIKDALIHRQKLSSEAQRLTRKAMVYIHNHYATPIGREDVAQYVGVSEGYLSRCFTQETGLSLIHYLTRYRIQQAKQLLASDEMTVTEIALKVGFSDGNYFSRAFRREVGLSPLAYRRKR